MHGRVLPGAIAASAWLVACGPLRGQAPAGEIGEHEQARPWLGAVAAPPEVAVRLPGGRIEGVVAVGDVTGDGEGDWVVTTTVGADHPLYVVAGPLTGETVLPGGAWATIAEPGVPTTLEDAVVVGFRGGFVVGSPNHGPGRDGRVLVFDAPIAPTATLASAKVLSGSGDEHAGAALAVADLDGDGDDDLAVGAWGYGYGHGLYDWDAGRVYIVPGPFVGGALGMRAAGTITGSEGYNSPVLAQVGHALAVLDDANGDGLPELAVGAPEIHEPNGEGTIGIVMSPHVGSAKGEWDPERLGGGSLVGFGYALAAMDAEGDGGTDLIAHGHSGLGSQLSIFTDPGPGIWADATTEWIQDGGSWAYRMGALPVGDVDGDGYDDLQVTAPRLGAAVMLAYGPIPAWKGTLTALTDLDAHLPLGDRPVAAGDVDGDGADDLSVLGADGGDDVWWTWLQPQPEAPGPVPLAGLSVGDLVITELMADPVGCDDRTAEWIELYNATGAAVDLAGLELRDAANTLGRLDASVIVPAGGRVVLGIGAAAGWCDAAVTPAGFYGATPQLNNKGPEHLAAWGAGIELDRTASYTTTRAGQSWSAFGADAASNDTTGGWCTAAPTPGAPNACP